MIHLRVQFEPFSHTEEYRALENTCPNSGGIATFTGRVRNTNLEKSVNALYLQHYPGMTERLIATICQEAQQRWPLDAIHIVHRVGSLLPGDAIVFVGTASAHRHAALESCEFLMDQLKTRATFWKREEYADGHQWLDARDSDRNATERWQKA